MKVKRSTGKSTKTQHPLLEHSYRDFGSQGEVNDKVQSRFLAFGKCGGIFFTLERSRWNASDLILHKRLCIRFPFPIFPRERISAARRAEHKSLEARTYTQREHARNRCSMNANIESRLSRGGGFTAHRTRMFLSGLKNARLPCIYLILLDLARALQL